MAAKYQNVFSLKRNIWTGLSLISELLLLHAEYLKLSVPLSFSSTMSFFF